MRILDTKKRVAEERELREFRKWLDSASSTAPLDANDVRNIWHLWDGFTIPMDELKRMVDSLRKRMSTT